jgi:hypothetical protein
MTQDDILRMAREAGLNWCQWTGCFTIDRDLSAVQVLERFAAKMAAHVLAHTNPPAILLNTADLDPELLRDMLAKSAPMPLVPMPAPTPQAIAEAIAAEREACAKIGDGYDYGERNCGEEIRARGQQ